MRHTTFKPDRILAVLVGTSKFDAVLKKEKNEKGMHEAYYDNLPDAKKDCDDLRECLKHYGLHQDEEDFYFLDDNPSSKQIDQTMKILTKRLKEGREQKPAINYIVIFLFAGHGLLKEGE